MLQDRLNVKKLPVDRQLDLSNVLLEVTILAAGCGCPPKKPAINEDRLKERQPPANLADMVDVGPQNKIIVKRFPDLDRAGISHNEGGLFVHLRRLVGRRKNEASLLVLYRYHDNPRRRAVRQQWMKSFGAAYIGNPVAR